MPPARCCTGWHAGLACGYFFRARRELINLLPPWFSQKVTVKLCRGLWTSECLGMRLYMRLRGTKRILKQRLLRLRMCPFPSVAHYQCVIVQAYAWYPLCGSILWPESMSASERINWNKMCRPLAPLKVFHIIPLILLRVRSTTIKGDTVYLNLWPSACQMWRSFSFISSHEPYFYFHSEFVTLHFLHRWERRKVNFLLLEGGGAKFEHCLIWLGKLAEIEGFGVERRTRFTSPLAQPPCTDEDIDTTEGLGPINTAFTYTCQTFSQSPCYSNRIVAFGSVTSRLRLTVNSYLKSFFSPSLAQGHKWMEICKNHWHLEAPTDLAEWLLPLTPTFRMGAGVS